MGGAWADALLLRFLGHSAWATNEVLEHCLGLGDQALLAAGTDGTVHETLTHLVESDAGFLGLLVGGEDEPLTGAAPPDVLRRLAERARAGWQAYAESGPDHERVFGQCPSGFGMPAWAATVQAIHHANDHRAHVGTILGAHGLPIPNGSGVWDYGEVQGAMPFAEAE